MSGLRGEQEGGACGGACHCGRPGVDALCRVLPSTTSGYVPSIRLGLEGIDGWWAELQFLIGAGLCRRIVGREVPLVCDLPPIREDIASTEER